MSAVVNDTGPAPDGHVVELGQAAVARDGTDVTLVALASTVPLALAAAEQVGADGISAEVIDLRSLIPLDMATVLASVRHTSRLIIVKENPCQGGWAARSPPSSPTRASSPSTPPSAGSPTPASPFPSPASWNRK
jgi:pyruvate/2-oxoglutarate/acetoin dehydrogenase E1 component